MRHFKLHPAFYDKPVCLGDAQLQQPMQVLQDFFSSYSLSEIRQAVWDMAEAALTTDNHLFDTAEERAHVTEFCRQLEMVLEAAYMLQMIPILAPLLRLLFSRNYLLLHIILYFIIFVPNLYI